MFKPNDKYFNKKADKATYGSDAAKKSISSAPSSGMSANKAVAAASMAQQMGVIPQGGGMNESDGAMGGAVSGAATGAAFGPYGAAVGAVAGAVMGAAQSRAAAKAHNAKLEANKIAAIGKIEEEKGKNISNALGSMGMRMGAGFR